MKLLKWGIGFVLVRTVLVLVLLMEIREHGEGDLAVLLDIPTVAVWYVLGLLRLGWSIRDAADPGFLVLGSCVWFCMGMGMGYALERLGRRCRQHMKSWGRE